MPACRSPRCAIQDRRGAHWRNRRLRTLLPHCRDCRPPARPTGQGSNRSEQIRSEEHTSELQSLMRISYAVFCLKKKKILTLKRTRKKIWLNKGKTPILGQKKKTN